MYLDPVRLVQWQSSEVDWCETNYEITTAVAEFWNTMSNVLFLVFPPLLIHLFQQYGKLMTAGVHVVWVLLFVVGVASVYFHATLSLMGQFLDEIAILWLFMANIALFAPRRFIPPLYRHNRPQLYKVVLGLSAVITVLSFIKPAINCFALMTLGIPASAMLVSETRRCSEKVVVKLSVRCLLMWFIALASWICDKFFCSAWQYVGFPYLHGIWHVFIALAAYQACVIFAYHTAVEEKGHMHPVIRYWPLDELDYKGIPYVVFEEPGSSLKKL